MMGLSDGRKSFRKGLAVLIQYWSVTATHPPSHVAVAYCVAQLTVMLNTVLKLFTSPDLRKHTHTIHNTEL